MDCDASRRSHCNLVKHVLYRFAGNFWRSQVYFATLVSHAWVLVMAVCFLIYLLQLKDYHPIVARIQGRQCRDANDLAGLGVHWEVIESLL